MALVLAGAANAQSQQQTVPCDLTFAPEKSEPGTWRATCTLECGERHRYSEGSRELPVGQRLLLGMTVGSSEDEYLENSIYEGEGETDLPAQIVVIDPGKPQTTVRFQAPNFSPAAKTPVQVAIWSLKAVVPCINARDGCVKYGYALDGIGCADSTTKEACVGALKTWTFELK